MIVRFVVIFLTGCVLALVFFVWTFPYPALEERLEYEIQQRTGLQAELNGLDYAFPLGLSLDSALIQTPDQSSFTIGQTRLNLKPLSLAMNTIAVGAQGEILGGRLQGRLQLAPLLKPDRFDTRMDILELDLARLNLPSRLQTVEDLQGTSFLHLELAGKMNELLLAKGKGNFQVRQGAVSLAQPQDPLLFEDLGAEGTWELEQKSLGIQQCQIKAKGAEVQLQGRIGLAENLVSSRLQLEGRIRLSGANPRAYSLARNLLGSPQTDFNLSGSLQNPRYSLRAR